MKFAPPVLGLLLAFPALAQVTPSSGGLTPQAPDLIMPAGKIYIDLTTLPAARAAHKTARSEINCTGLWNGATCTVASQDVPARPSYSVNRGSFRIKCSRSHLAFDDPIVWPGQSGRTHLHQFFGNTSTRSSTDLDNMASSGDSTCTGGTLNRSGYWSPVFVYHRPGHARDGEVMASDSSLFYYKNITQNSTDTGGFGGTAMIWPPANFRMITGSATNTAPLNTGRFFFDCQIGGSFPVPFPGYRFDHIPTSAEATAIGGCDDITMAIVFPECWDDPDLDSADHQSHVAFISNTTGCPSTHPKFFPTISLNIHTTVTTADLDYIRLSSDLPKAEAITLGGNCTSGNNWCAGRSVHSDWVNGWSTANINGWGMSVTDAILRQCLSLGAPPSQDRDCHAHLLGSPLEAGLSTDEWWILY